MDQKSIEITTKNQSPTHPITEGVVEKSIEIIEFC